MELKLLDHQDVYSGRELAHIATGIPYASLNRNIITEVVRELAVPESHRLYDVRWPGGQHISCLYILRNHERYAGKTRSERLRRILAHLRTLPTPPKAPRYDWEIPTTDPAQMELDF